MPRTEENLGSLLARVGQRVHTRRKTLGYSQEKLAELSCISLNTIRRIESERKCTGLDIYYNVAHALQMSLSELLAQDESGDQRLGEIIAAWYGIQRERDREVAYVTFMAMLSALKDQERGQLDTV